MPRKMRDSGVEWIGQVPEGWRVNYLFQVVSQVKERNEDLKETNLLSLSYGKIKRKSIETVGGLLPASFDGYNIIENNDIVLRLTDLQNDQHSLRVGIARERGIITSAYITIRPSTAANPDFLFHSLFAFDVMKGFYGMGAGVRQGLNYDEVKQIKILLPPLPVQCSIANHLDAQCAEIGAAIASARQSIEDYKALKKSLVFETVTGKRQVPTALTQRTQRSQRDAESSDRINGIYRIEGEKPAAANTENAKGAKCRKDDYEALRTSANFAFSASAPAGSQNPVNPVNPVKETVRPMRDSGVAWIGAIPEGWRVVQLKRIAKIQTGNTPPKSENSPYYSDESGVPWIKADDLGTNRPITKTAEYITEDGLPLARIMPCRSVYVCCIASIGKCGLAECKCGCNQQINSLQFSVVADWRYGYYSTAAFEQAYIAYANGNVLKILNASSQGRIWYVLPPLSEQRAIADYLDEKCAAIDALVAEKEALIADLEAYKKSLIFEVVTGKRPVFAGEPLRQGKEVA